MKKNQIIMGAGLAILTFIMSVFVSVVFSINMVEISPKNLAQTIKKDPETFINAIKEASEKHQKQSAEKAFEERRKNPAKIETKGRVTFGPEKAPVTIVEFADFQCFYCSKANQRMKALIKKYEGKVQLVYKHFPLDFHPFALPAAEYFEAIALIDHESAKKFHDFIFDNWDDYAKLKEESGIEDSLEDIVKQLKLDDKAIQANMDKAKKIVQQDMEEAKKIGVQGTPSFFVNGVKSQDLIFAIEQFLEEKK